MQGPGPARRLLRKLDFRVIRRRHLERNELFDFVDGRLRKKGCVLRLRFTAGSCLLTFKGRPLGLRPHKVRREIEVETKEGRSLGQILEMAGLMSVLRYEKFRTLYASQVRKRRRSSGQIALDETPVGTFLELEGSPLWIDRTARRLGFSREDYLTRPIRLSIPAISDARAENRVARYLRGGNSPFHTEFCVIIKLGFP